MTRNRLLGMLCYTMRQVCYLPLKHHVGFNFISCLYYSLSHSSAKELEKDIHGSAADSLPAEKKLVLYDKIFAAYHEARSSIRNDLVTAANSKNVKDELSELDKAIGAILGK
ncbi:hypothetical protein BC332_03377 [Capsicum chinense]|nr:hypothetical protein BC332_03377 [Capsicum chinense]